jgi:hypothetical protein
VVVAVTCTLDISLKHTTVDYMDAVIPQLENISMRFQRKILNSTLKLTVFEFWPNQNKI